MDVPETDRTPLEAVTGAAGSEVVDALELLSDQTRLAILLALWDGYDPYAGTETMSFSEIHDRVAVRDSANFSYHLDRLTDHFVEKTADGYRLRNAGRVFVRTVIAGAGLESPEIRTTELDLSCTRCAEARMEIGYRNGTLYLTCPVCEGYTTTEGHPRGTIAAFEFDPAGLRDRSPMELLAAGAIRSRNRFRTMREGV
ncbi:MAG: winged helix-turn-helix domain-containing protein, partial [Halobacteriales archaeon]|nr:winged helix-turn-helix domain-containing protein [Halobacteriales archaeon]